MKRYQVHILWKNRFAKYVYPLLLTVILAGSWFAYSGKAGSSRDLKVAPAISVSLLDGSEWHLADSRGRIVVVSFWASWCAPCKEEAPALEKASTANPDVLFVGIAPKTDDPDHVMSFVKTYDITYAIGRDASEQISIDYGIYGYPTTVFIDPYGHISTMTFSALDEQSIEKLIVKAASEAS